MVQLRRGTRVRRGAVAGAVIFLGWVAVVSVLILREPEPGAPSRQAAVAALREALTARDTERTASLVSAPGDPEVTAGAYLAGFERADVGDVDVRQLGDSTVLVEGTAGEDAHRFEHRFALVTEDDRWFVVLVPLP